MGFGLYGKLPQKRDFISTGLPGEVIQPFETWLQSAVAASRSELGRGWEEAYLVAPIWRFWIGSAIFGRNCAGALMPSVDGVGRYFPLMAMWCCEPAESLPPPPYAPQETWFSAIEKRLLAVLDEGAAIGVDAVLAGLAAPALDGRAPTVERSTFKGAPLWRGDAEMDAPSLLAAIFEDDYRQVANGRSYWWAPGTATRGPLLHARNGLPDPYFHTQMLRSMAK
jgi:type VI secretion system protein ImpM